MSTRISHRSRPSNSFLLSRAGFTLFELIVAITIVALMLGLVVSRMDDYLDLNMKKTANRLSSTIRYLYNKAATEGVYMRLMIDITAQTYWVEATKEPFLMGVTEGKEEGKKETKEGEKAEEKKAEVTEEGTTGTEAERLEKRGQIPKLEFKQPTFTQVESYLLRPTKLPDNVFFKDVMTEHQPVPVEGGQAAVYFFPNGYVEHAVINIRDEDDEVHYSLETNPVTGQVRIENEYRMLEKK